MKPRPHHDTPTLAGGPTGDAVPRLSLPPGEEPGRARRLLERSATSLAASSLAASVRAEPSRSRTT